MSTYYIDSLLYFLFLATIALTLYAQIKVSSTFRRYSVFMTASGRNAADVARMILSQNGLSHVRIERVRGELTDHYDPRHRVLRLSESVYDSTSAAAIGVAAHEAGHAIQYAEGYAPVRIRTALVPVTRFASGSTWILILLGMFFYYTEIGYYFVMIGIGLFAVTTLFQLVTLPCEFNASRRAMNALETCGWYSGAELAASKKVLSAAALTYVAALLTSFVQLLRLISRFGNRRR